MAYKDFMNKVRYLDNLTAKWIMRHFYFMFFQIVLVGIFIFWFVNIFNVIDASIQATRADLVSRLLMTQSINTTIIVLLMILNSFWLLFMFNGIQRISTLLKDVSYYTSRLRPRGKNI